MELTAYLDPGSGSMLLQMAAAGLAAVGVTAKLYWHRIKSLLRLGGKESDPPREH